MSVLIVTQNTKDWELSITGVQVISAKSYLTDTQYVDMNNAKVYNLCRSYRYQSAGYYVSLLAEARGHQVVPSVTTIQDLKYQTIIRSLSDDLDDLIQKSLDGLHSDEFILSIYFGKNVAKKYDRLSRQLFSLFGAPLLRATFQYDEKAKKWHLQNISAIAVTDVPEYHQTSLNRFAREYFNKPKIIRPKKRKTIYDLAILINPDEEAPPSDEKALQRFVKAAHSLDFYTEFITRDDYAHINEFDALFIRETTAVNHHTYRFARKAFAEGLVVIDDPLSILRCTNKVYLAELLTKAGITIPSTMIVHKDNKDQIIDTLGFPCILKQPDSSFSQGVAKATSETELNEKLDRLLDISDLIIAQKFLPTDFDWRIGIIDGDPFYACKYYMARGHWQIMNWNGTGANRTGKSETFHLSEVPKPVVTAATKAAGLIGNGLYGVDVKLIDGKPYVIEVNDNPSIDHGVEDAVLKDEVYLRIMRVIFNRIEESKQRRWI